VPVEGAGADLGALGDVVEGCVDAVFEEHVAGGGDDPLVVAAGVGAHRCTPSIRRDSPVSLAHPEMLSIC
jgi:hypothetical protein